MPPPILRCHAAYALALPLRCRCRFFAYAIAAADAIFFRHYAAIIDYFRCMPLLTLMPPFHATPLLLFIDARHGLILLILFLLRFSLMPFYSSADAFRLRAATRCHAF